MELMGERPNIYWPKSVSTKREVGRERKEGGQRKWRSTQEDGDHEVHDNRRRDCGIILEGISVKRELRAAMHDLRRFKKESTLNGIDGCHARRVIKGWRSNILEWVGVSLDQIFCLALLWQKENATIFSKVF